MTSTCVDKGAEILQGMMSNVYVLTRLFFVPFVSGTVYSTPTRLS
jgi:hypothetical protein